MNRDRKAHHGQDGIDFAKHAPPKDFPKLAAIWRSIPLQLAKESSKFARHLTQQAHVGQVQLEKRLIFVG
ncbi:MAG: DUF4143 domain-containing protein [Oscillospiraceae bacterium]|nr:DUF4143 domain-containing protein [Oscillospiraceae bacterium]